MRLVRVLGRVDWCGLVWTLRSARWRPPESEAWGQPMGSGAEGVGVSVEGPLWPTLLRACGALTGYIEGVMLMLRARKEHGMKARRN